MKTSNGVKLPKDYGNDRNKDDMADALEKIQTIIKESKTLALLSKKNCEDYKFLSKEALEKIFSDKNLNIVSLPEYPELQKKWKLIIPEKKNTEAPKQTSIRIPKNQYKIKEINYENSEEFLNLILTAENGEIDKSAVIFEPVLPKADAVFCFFEPKESEMLKEFEQKIIFPEKEKIIFFASNGITAAEKISQIIRIFAPDIFSSKEISTLLFASLIAETNNFNHQFSQEILRFGSELLSYGADKETVKAILNKEKTLSSARLLGRGLSRTHVDENLPVSWTFLSAEDFKKTGVSDNSNLFFYNILSNIRENIPYRPLSLLFWQNDRQINALAAADEEKSLMPLASALGIKMQSKYFITGPFNNFSEAEMYFRNALKEIDLLKI